MSKRVSLSDRRRARVAAAKERKKKIFAIAGLGVLGLLLFIQGPKMLELFGSSPTVTAAPAAPATTAAEPVEPPKEARLGSTSIDPFAARGLTDNDPQAGSIPAPAGTRDPFLPSGSGSPAPTDSPAQPAPTLAPSPLPKKIIIGTPKPGGVTTRGWIVVIASIPTSNGRRSAERFATKVRRDGLTDIGVLESSTRKPLRAGYFVVYNGPYATLSAVQRAADHVHAFGYRTAYVREIIRY
jgi:hypothetical protein